MPSRYSLLIATYDRPDALRMCLRLAATQTVPPSQIVVVGAGHWRGEGMALVEAIT